LVYRLVLRTAFFARSLRIGIGTCLRRAGGSVIWLRSFGALLHVDKSQSIPLPRGDFPSTVGEQE